MKYVLILAASAAGVALGVSPAAAQCGKCRTAAPAATGGGHGFASAAPAPGCSMGAMPGMGTQTPTSAPTPAMLGMPAPTPAAPAPGHEHHGVAAPAASPQTTPAVAPTSSEAPAGSCPKCKTAAAAEAKEVKLTGTLVLTKCSHKTCKLAGKSMEALQVREGDRVVNYILADLGTGDVYAAGAAVGSTDVTLTGTVTEADGRKWIKPSGVTLQ